MTPTPGPRSATPILSEQQLKGLYPKYICPVCNDWFHMPWKYCKCPREELQESSSLPVSNPVRDAKWGERVLMVGCIGGCIVTVLAVVGTIGFFVYVAAHFVFKYW